MKINSVIEEDNGNWNCTILGKTDTSDYEHVTQNFTLKVAKAPTKVYLQEEDRVLTSLFMNISAQNSALIQCIAEFARVEPEFNWFLNSTEFSSTKNYEENGNFVSEFEYFGKVQDSGQVLKCQVEHMAYTKEDLKSNKNIAQVKLDIVGESPALSSSAKLGIGITILVLILISGVIFIIWYKRNQENGEYQRANNEESKLEMVTT